MSTISNGADGANIDAKVDQNNRVHVSAVNQQADMHATTHGDSYNINTGTIALTSGTASGVLYFKNDDVKDFVVQAIAVGLGSAASVTDLAVITIIKNPTSVSFSAAVDINQNRNFGSSDTLATTSDVFKGAEGATVTGGSDILYFFQGEGGRLFATIDLIIPRGQSLAVTIDPNISSGTMNIYCALIGYLRDEQND